jgi:hypothetical protein
MVPYLHIVGFISINMGRGELRWNLVQLPLQLTPTHMDLCEFNYIQDPEEKLILSHTRNCTVVLLFRLIQSERSIQYVYMHECTISTYKRVDIPVNNSIYMHESTPCMDKLNLWTIYMSRFYKQMQDNDFHSPSTEHVSKERTNII